MNGDGAAPHPPGINHNTQRSVVTTQESWPEKQHNERRAHTLTNLTHDRTCCDLCNDMGIWLQQQQVQQNSLHHVMTLAHVLAWTAATHSPQGPVMLWSSIGTSGVPLSMLHRSSAVPTILYVIPTLFLPCTLCFAGWSALIPNSFPMHCMHVRKCTQFLLHGVVGVPWSKSFCMSVTSTPCIVGNLYAVPTLFLKNLALFVHCLERRQCHYCSLRIRQCICGPLSSSLHLRHW